LLGGDVQVELKLLEVMVLMKRLVTAPTALKMMTGVDSCATQYLDHSS